MTPGENSDPGKLKALGGQLRTELSKLRGDVRARRSQGELTNRDKDLLDLKLKIIKDLDEDLGDLVRGKLFPHGRHFGCFKG